MTLREWIVLEQKRRQRTAWITTSLFLAALSLACFVLCPQLGWGPSWFMDWGALALFEKLGHRGCLLVCGAFYIFFVWTGLQLLIPRELKSFVSVHRRAVLLNLSIGTAITLGLMELQSGAGLEDWSLWLIGVVIASGLTSISRPGIKTVSTA